MHFHWFQANFAWVLQIRSFFVSSLCSGPPAFEPFPSRHGLGGSLASFQQFPRGQYKISPNGRRKIQVHGRRRLEFPIYVRGGIGSVERLLILFRLFDQFKKFRRYGFVIIVRWKVYNTVKSSFKNYIAIFLWNVQSLF